MLRLKRYLLEYVSVYMYSRLVQAGIFWKVGFVITRNSSKVELISTFSLGPLICTQCSRTFMQETPKTKLTFSNKPSVQYWKSGLKNIFSTGPMELKCTRRAVNLSTSDLSAFACAVDVPFSQAVLVGSEALTTGEGLTKTKSNVGCVIDCTADLTTVRRLD